MQVWDHLVNQTKKASKDHAALAEIYSTHVSQRCTGINEDLQRMYKKVCKLDSKARLETTLIYIILVP